jgi:hypothetical protein
MKGVRYDPRACPRCGDRLTKLSGFPYCVRCKDVVRDVYLTGPVITNVEDDRTKVEDESDLKVKSRRTTMGKP